MSVSRTRWMLATALLLGLAGTAAARPAAAPPAPAAGRPGDQRFMYQAAIDGMVEMRLAKLARERTDSDEILLASQKIEQDHRNANDQLRIIAQRMQVSLPTTLPPARQAEVARLAALDGTAFAKAYARTLVEDHRKAIALFGKEAETGGDPQLRRYASDTLPILKTHLNMAESLRKGKSAGSLQGLNRNNNSVNHADNTPISVDGRHPGGR